MELAYAVLFEFSLRCSLINQEQIQEQKENKLVKEFFQGINQINFYI